MDTFYEKIIAAMSELRQKVTIVWMLYTIIKYYYHIIKIVLNIIIILDDSN